MLRLDNSVAVMVATEDEAAALEAALKDGPVVLHTQGGKSFKLVILDDDENYVNQAEKILG